MYQSVASVQLNSEIVTKRFYSSKTCIMLLHISEFGAGQRIIEMYMAGLREGTSQEESVADFALQAFENFYLLNY